MTQSKRNWNNIEAITAGVMAKRAITDKIGFYPSVDYSPHQPTVRQKVFLGLNDKLEVFYGGAAGGGKSDALLMAALQYVHIANYAALLLRRTYADLARPGALMDRAYEWLNGKAHWNMQEKKWTFPSGATLSFGYLDTEVHKYQYQSAEFQFIGFDELSHFTESQYTYLFSRLRRGKLSGSVPIRMRAGSNPPETPQGMWIKDRFLPDDYDPEHIREDAIYVKEVVDEETGDKVERYFVPAKLDDNPHIDINEYEKSMRELDPVTRARLRRGDWQISAKGDILYMWSDAHSVISWSQFEKVVYGRENGMNTIPHNWQLGCFQDWGTSKDHPCVTQWYATAAADAPANLEGSVFLYRSMMHIRATAREVKHDLLNVMRAADERERCRLWLMSHEANSARLEYLSTDKDSPISLPFSAWQTGKTRGIEQLKWALLPKGEDPHVFKPELTGQPKLFLIVDDDQLLTPKDERGMYRFRVEAPVYKWNTPRSGETPTKLEPYALFNDAMDVARSAAAEYWPRIEELDQGQERRNKLQSQLGFKLTRENLKHEGHQIALAVVSSKLEREWDMEDNPNNWDSPLMDISDGW